MRFQMSTEVASIKNKFVIREKQSTSSSYRNTFIQCDGERPVRLFYNAKQ